MNVASPRVPSVLIVGVISAWLSLSVGFGTNSSFSQQPDKPVKFGGTFDELKPVQQKLVRDWYQHFNQIMGKDLDPEVAYGELPYSTRTTFEAVTNAAMNTKLTDDSGHSLGKAIDLVGLVETVRGEVPKTSGDVQFRIYVVLVPGAVDLLERSVEFKRGRDNTHFHVDYPVNYRLDGTPSLQFSITEDGQRADIDVDYKSSSFPKLFFDGHLRASNSDVRPGDNYQTHVSRWQGFSNWWRNLFGLPIIHKSGSDTPPEEKPMFPPNPRVSDHEDLAVAVEDFLSSWLIKQEPLEALPYYGATSFACISDLEPDAPTTDMAPFRILRDMKEINQLLGKIKSLEDAVEAIDPGNSQLKPIKNPHAKLFALNRIPDELVEDLECRYSAESIALKHKESLKDHFAASMKLKSPHWKGLDLFQVWAKQEGYWKIVAFHLQPFADHTTVPDSTSRQPRERAHQPLSVDPGLVVSVERFMNEWFLQKDQDGAMEFFSKKSYDCVGLFDDASQSPITNRTEAVERLRQDLGKISDFAEKPAALKDAITAAEPWTEDLHLITHDQQDAYALISYSDYHAEQLECRHRKEGREYHGKKPRKHGGYFAVSFQLKKTGERPPVVTIVWAKEKKAWKIVSFDIEMN